MTMKTKKTLQHIAAVAVVLLTLCLVFAAPVSANGVITSWNELSNSLDGSTIQLGNDISVTDPTAITNCYGTLDLNGKNLTITYTGYNSFNAFSTSGVFTITDSIGGGEINLISTYDPIDPWHVAINVIEAESGAVVTIDGKETTTLSVNSTSGQSGMYVIHVASGASLTVNNGNIESSYTGIRAFLNSDTSVARITISGGSITADGTAIWIQQSNTVNKNQYSLEVNGGSITSTKSGAAIGYWIRNNDEGTSIVRNTIINDGILTSTTNGKYHYGVIGYENAYDDNDLLGINANNHLLQITEKVTLINKNGGDIIGLYNTSFYGPYFSYVYTLTEYEDGTHVSIKNTEETNEGYVVTFTVPQNGKEYIWSVDNSVTTKSNSNEYTHTFVQESTESEHTVMALVNLSNVYSIGAYPLTITVPAAKEDTGDKENVYQIVYHANKDDNPENGDNTLYEEITLSEGSTMILLQENKFINDGYFFVGWSTTADDESVEYFNGATVEVGKLFGEGSSIELYAIWAKSEVEGIEKEAIFDDVTSESIVDNEDDLLLNPELYPVNSTTITLSNGAQLTLVFNDEDANNNFASNPSGLNVPIANATVVYPWGNASLNGALVGSTNHLVFFEMSDLISIPTISGAFNKDVESKIIAKNGGEDAGILAMISAEGADNTNITGVCVIFEFYPHGVLTDPSYFTAYHVDSDGATPLELGKTFYVNERDDADGEKYWEITLLGEGFSSYAVGYVEPTNLDDDEKEPEEDDKKDEDDNKTPVYVGGGGGGKNPATVTPEVPPTEEPTDDPSDVPGEDLPDIPDVPVTPEEPSTPAPLLAVLAGLGAAVVLRRK